MRPVEPNSSAQPSVRATTEISSGPRIDQQEEAAPARRHAVEDVGFGRAEHGRDQRRSAGDAERAPEDLAIIRIGRDLVPVLQRDDRLDALVLPQSWNDSSTVMASGISTTPTNSSSAGAGEQPRARVPSPARRWPEPCRRQCSCGSSADTQLMSSARQARWTASPSRGLRPPSFWRITIAGPASRLDTGTANDCPGRSRVTILAADARRRAKPIRSGRTLTVTGPATPAGAGALQEPATEPRRCPVRSTVAGRTLVLPRNCATKAVAGRS